jgi:putative hydrolase of the HAD superfamily
MPEGTIMRDEMKYFLFDIGNVLADFDDADLLAAVINSTRHPRNKATAREPELDDLVERGLISDQQYLTRLNDAKGLSWDLDELTKIWAGVFRKNEAGVRLFEKAVAAGTPVYLLSNIAAFHIDAIELNWPGFFNGSAGMFLSYRIGIRKPHSDIFRHVLHTLNVGGNRCFFIDDLPENVEAAREAGMTAYQYVPENHGSIHAAACEFFGW